MSWGHNLHFKFPKRFSLLQAEKEVRNGEGMVMKVLVPGRVVRALWRNHWRISKMTSAAPIGRGICAELIIPNISGQSRMPVTF